MSVSLLRYLRCDDATGDHDASLHAVVNARRRLELVAMLSEEGRFDFDAAERAWVVLRGQADA
jgi:hypothetical protein